MEPSRRSRGTRRLTEGDRERSGSLLGEERVVCAIPMNFTLALEVRGSPRLHQKSVIVIGKPPIVVVPELGEGNVGVEKPPLHPPS